MAGVLLALTLTAGCHKLRPPSMAPAVPPPPSTVAPPNPDTIGAIQIAGQVRQITSLLARLPDSPANGVPDAVLNGAQCLIVSHQDWAADQRQARALISCRAGDRWSPPGFLALTLAGPRVSKPATLLWIANRQGSEAVRRNILRGIRFQAGPLVRQSATPAENQLNAEIMSYKYMDGRLWGSRVTIVSARPDNGAASAFYHRGPEFQPAAQGSSPVAEATQQFIYAATSFFNTITPVGILIHHSGLIPIKVAVQLKEQVADMIDEFHARRGFEIICFGRVYHVGYHYLILPSGKVEAGRPERCEGAHARGYNSFLGIALVGDFSPATNPSGLYGPSTPTRAQMRSLIKLCRRLRRRYHIPIQRVMRHSDVTPTYCPGSRFPIQALLRALERGGPS